jgi:hypothetical protein
MSEPAARSHLGRWKLREQVDVTPTSLPARALKIGGVLLSMFGTIGGVIGAIERDVFEALLGFADIFFGGIFYLHTKAAR